MNGIWDNQLLHRHNSLPQRNKLTLDEGNTPFKFVELAGHQLLGIKDENYNPNGSFKDRSLAYQISMYLENDINNFVISSSGNAAISAAGYCELAKTKLKVFVAEDVNALKYAKLQEIAARYAGVTIDKTKQAKSAAIRFARDTGAINLRGSQDDLAIIGFKTIAYELSEQYPKLDAVFIPCSSGTSTLALCLAFKEMQLSVRVYACQSSRIHPIAKAFVEGFEASETSLADAITDRVALRRDEVVAAIKESRGSGIIITDAELEAAKALLEQYGLEYSYNSLLGFAGFLKVDSSEINYPVVIASGL